MGVVTSYDRCGWLDDASIFLCNSKIVYKIEVYYINSGCGRVIRDFEREAKTRCNF